jgi:hypothetical protein
VGTRKIKLFYVQLHSLPCSWPCAPLLCITAASDLVIPSAEQRCIIKLLVHEKVKPAEILRRLKIKHGEETLSCANCLICGISFLKAVKKSPTYHMLGKRDLGMRQSDSC